MQAFFWISLIKSEVQLPLSPPHYHLLARKDARIQYGVDHSTYMSTLAKDIDAAPGLLEIWLTYGSKVLLCYWYVYLASCTVVLNVLTCRSSAALEQRSRLSTAFFGVLNPIRPQK